MTLAACPAPLAAQPVLTPPAPPPRLSAVARGAVLVHVINPHAPRVGARYFGHCDGMTVDQAIQAAGWKLPWNTILVRGEEQKTSRADWETDVIGRDELVVLITQPLGNNGGTSQILATVASIALALAAPNIGVALLGKELAAETIALGVSYGAVATVGVVLGGTTLISALLPHPKGFQSVTNQSPTYSLSAQGNTARLGQPIPERGGEFRFLPDLASAAYFDFSGSQQNLYELFELGMGDFDISEVGIANNPIWVKDEAHPDGAYTGTYPEITLEFLPPGTPNGLFADNAVTSTDVSSVTMIGTNEPDYGWLGPFVTNPPTTQTTQLAFDVGLPAGLFRLDGNNLQNATATAEIQLRPIDDEGFPTGTGEWTTVTAPTLTMATRDAVRLTFPVTVDAGRYEARFQRTNEKSTDANTSDTMVMLAMRAFLPNTPTSTDTYRIALKARTTKNLNGSSAQQFYVKCTRKLPSYNPVTKTWSAPAATRSIAAFASYILKSQNGLRKTDSQIDLAYLWGTLHPLWEARGDYFDGTFDTGGSAWEALQQVLRCGRAEPLRTGKFVAFTRLQPKLVRRHSFSPLNMLPGTFNMDLAYFDEKALDALWIDYIDRRNYQPASVYCALPDSTVDPDDAPHQQWLGITDRAHAWREGITLCAQNRYQRILPNWQTELDGRVLLRGDKVGAGHWVSSWGQAASVVALERDADGDILTLDQPWVTPEKFADDQKMISLTAPDGRTYGPVTVDLLDDGEDGGRAVVRMTQAATMSVGKYTNKHPRDWPQFSGFEDVVMEWPRAIFGTATQLDKDVLIVSMKPSGNTCQVAAVLDDPRVYTADQGEPPEETNPPDAERVDNLVITRILLNEVAATGGGTQLNVTIIGAPDAVTFDVSYAWGTDPSDMVDLTDQARTLVLDGQAGTIVVSARAIGASGNGNWFTGDAYEATGIPPNDDDTGVTNVAYSAGNFTAGGAMTWSVDNADQTTFWYSISGSIITVSLVITASSIGGTVDDALFVQLPGGKTASTGWTGLGYLVDNGASASAVLTIGAGDDKLKIQRLDGAVNFSLSSNNTGVRFTAAFPIN